MSVQLDSGCVLLFSGGRDSTLAALRLAERLHFITLLTITSGHLAGIENVRTRIVELATKMNERTEWVHVAADTPTSQMGTTEIPSCLPCHHTYLSVASRIADQRGINTLATGYTGYQSDWLEQTPYAISRLRAVLEVHGKYLLLPVSDVKTKEEAVLGLRAYGVSDSSLEQKCLRQQFNQVTPAEESQAEIDRWAEGLNKTLGRCDAPQFDVISASFLAEVANP